MKVALVVLLASLTAASAQAPTTTVGKRKAWIIKGAGTTTVTTRLGGEPLTVEIHTWQVPVNDRDEDGPRPYTQCTYSQNPCSITDWIHVRLGGKTLWIGPYDIAGLGDMHYLSISGSPSRLVLYIAGGDTVNSYDAHLIFNREHLIERVLYSLDEEHPFEVSHFYYGSIG